MYLWLQQVPTLPAYWLPQSLCPASLCIFLPGVGAACTWLGELCEEGLGQQADTEQQQQKQVSVDVPSPSKNTRLPSWSQAVGWYRKGASLGDAQSAAHLGYLLEQGRGVPAPDLQGAAEAYRQAAAGGVATAANNLATMYMQGRGVPKVQCCWLLCIQDQEAIPTSEPDTTCL
jgi:TPR repeat protein